MAGRHAAFERGVLALAAAQVQTLGNDLEKDHQLTNFLVALEIAVRVSKD